MNSSIGSTNVLVANIKPLYWTLWPGWVSAQYSYFKIATSTFVLPILEFIFIATSHKHFTFTITHVSFGNLRLFASYAGLLSPKNLKTAADSI